MVLNFLTKVFGSSNERAVKRIQPLVDAINGFEPRIQKLTDQEMVQTTESFKLRVSNGETLENLLPEAFALVREASLRTLNMRHFDAQLIGGVALHQGMIAETC